MNVNKTLLLTTVFLLFIVDLLTFHDVFELHTVRDWMTLAASIAAFIYLAKVSLKKVL